MTSQISAANPYKVCQDYHPGQRWVARFVAIFAGQSLSLVGTALTQFVLMWWITETTGSASALAIAGIMGLAPLAFLSPLGGTLADRYSRRLIMITTDAVSAACMAILILLFAMGAVQLWHVYAMMLVRSSMQALQGPASTASISMLVPTSFLSRANGLNQTIQGIMTIAAAPLGAAALGLMPIGWALSLDLFSALMGIIPLLIYRVPQKKVPPCPSRTFWSETKEGVSYVRANPAIFHFFLITSVSAMIMLPAFYLAPLMVKQLFQGDVSDVALLEGMSGLGMALGGIAVTIFAPKRRLVTFGILAIAFSNALIASTGFMPASMFPALIILWAFSGMMYTVGRSPMMALAQYSIPNELQGRSFSLLNTCVGFACPIGLLISIPLEKAIGIEALYIALGVVGAITTLLGFLSRPLMKLNRVAIAGAEDLKA